MSNAPHEARAAVEPGQLRLGIYLHFKGALYEVTGWKKGGADSNRFDVCYYKLNADGSRAEGRCHERELREFLCDVVHPDGSVCGHLSPYSPKPLICLEHMTLTSRRYAYLGTSYAPWMSRHQPWPNSAQ